MANSVPKTHFDESTGVPVSHVEPYCPPISAIANDPAKLFERQREAELREMEAVMSAQPGTPVPGTGPEVSIGIDAEWVHDPITRTNKILSIQFHLVGECGEFSHIEYLDAANGARPEFAKLIAKVILLAMEEGVVLEWPAIIIVVAFFLRADLTAFGDLARFKNQLDSVGRSVGTRGNGIPFDVQFEQKDIERLTRAKRWVTNDGNCSRVLQVKFIDLVRHVPVGTTLAELGELLGQPKIKLPAGAIERMDRLLAEAPQLYAEYAAQDALIAVYFLHRVHEVINRLLGDTA